MKTILLVEDEDELRKTIKSFLIAENFEVIDFNNVDCALKELQSKKVDLVISDIKIPGTDGLEFFDCFKKSESYKNQVPFVLMTGYADMITVENAFKLGVSELLSKPFNLETILLVINYLLNTEKAIGARDRRYFSVPIESYISANTDKFNLYIKSENNHILISKAEQDFQVQRLNNFMQKGVTHIYLDYSSYAQLLDFKMSTLDDSPYLRPLEEAREFYLKQLFRKNLGNSYLGKQMDSKSFARAASSLEGFLNFTLCNPDIADLLFVQFEKSGELAERLVMRAVTSIAIANIWKWSAPKVQFRIGLGSILCDVGLKSGLNLINKTPAELTMEEYKLVERHAEHGYEMLGKIENMPEEIKLVALQHHENCAGTGYPKGLLRNQLHSYSRIIHDVDEFLVCLHRQNPIDVEKTLKLMVSNPNKSLNEQVVKSLFLVFGRDLPSSLAGLPLPNVTNRLL